MIPLPVLFMPQRVRYMPKRTEMSIIDKLICIFHKKDGLR